MRIICFRFREMLYYPMEPSAQLRKVIRKRWHLPHFIHEAKGRAQGHTHRTPRNVTNEKRKQIFCWLGTVLEPPRRGKFERTCSRVDCLITVLYGLISTSNLVGKSMGSGAKLPVFESQLHHLAAVTLGTLQYLTCSISLFKSED